MKITDSGFIESNGYFYPDYPRQQVVEMLKFKSSGTALDIGAGFGNNVLPLLDSGFEVTAIETNHECVATLQKLSQAHDNKLHVIEEPLETLQLDQQFDAVICTMVLHFLSRPDALTSMENMKSWTNSGGINVITGYTDSNSDMGERINFLLHNGELGDIYKDWEILSYDEVMSGANNPAGKSFQSAKLIARKK